MASAPINDDAVRRAVVKNSSERLREELINCQTVFGKDEVDKFPRNKLVA